MRLLSSSGGRLVLFFSLYFSEGAPIGFIWWALPTMLRTAGVAVESITALTSILVLPWMFKFLWSPLIDAIRTSRWSLRSWIVSSQFVMGVSLIPLLIWDVTTHFVVMVPLLLIHAFSAATQDAAIDALAIASTPASERGSVNAWMQVGMLTGRSFLGGGGLLLVSLIGPGLVVLLLIVVIWSSSLLILRAGDTAVVPAGAESVRVRLEAIAARLRAVSRSRATWLGLLFAGIGGAGYEGLGAVAGPFLVDRGFPTGDIGVFFALNSVLGMIAGALVGGHLADRFGRRAAVSGTLILLCAAVFVVAATDSLSAGAGGAALLITMTAVYVCVGAFTAASYALFMELTDPTLGATQFSAFMAATNGCESWSSLAVGRGISVLGYPGAFSVLAVVSLATLPLLRYLPAGRERRPEEGVSRQR